MATVSQSPADPLAVAGWSDGVDPESKSDRYLSKRLAAAGADYKGVAITTFLLAAGVGVMLWLGSGILVEHWLVRGGLPTGARWIWFAAGAVVLAAAVVRWIVPLVRYRVNLVYAARILEREHPELHNDVVNAVLARAHADDTTPLIVKSLRRRAARQLSTVSADGVIDRTPALRLAYVLAGLMALACIYEVLAPKSFVVSAARLVAPWLGIAPPSRVRIAPPALAWRMPGEPAPADVSGRRLPVQGGTATLIRGRQLVVASEVRGLTAGERPALVVTPVREDGTAEPAMAAWRMPMAPGGADGMHTVLLPDATRGLDRPIELVISAGEARSPRIRVVVVDAPALLVREVRYDYPEYTGQADETVEWQGDLRAVEGTKVTIVAECNHPLESAWIDLGCDGKRKVPLTVGQQDLARGRGSFTLHLNADRSAAEYASYRLMFQPKSAPAASREPVTTEKMEYRIDVEPDITPDVSIEEPAEKVVRVPPSAPVTIRVRGEDPDFGLASVSVETRLAQGGEKPGEELLVGRRRKVFRGAATLIPERLGAGPGAVLEYRAVAKDTRPEAPNIAVTEWRALKIDAAAPPREPPPAPRDEDQKSDGEQGQPDAGGTPPKEGEGQEGEPGKGGAGAGDDAAPGEQGEQQGKDSDAGGASESGAGGDDSQKGDAAGDTKDGSQGENGGDGKDAGGKDSGGKDSAGGQSQRQEGSQQQGGKRGGGPTAANRRTERRESRATSRGHVSNRRAATAKATSHKVRVVASSNREAGPAIRKMAAREASKNHPARGSRGVAVTARRSPAVIRRVGRRAVASKQAATRNSLAKRKPARSNAGRVVSRVRQRPKTRSPPTAPMMVRRWSASCSIVSSRSQGRGRVKSGPASRGRASRERRPRNNSPARKTSDSPRRARARTDKAKTEKIRTDKLSTDKAKKGKAKKARRPQAKSLRSVRVQMASRVAKKAAPRAVADRSRAEARRERRGRELGARVSSLARDRVRLDNRRAVPREKVSKTVPQGRRKTVSRNRALASKAVANKAVASQAPVSKAPASQAPGNSKRALGSSRQKREASRAKVRVRVRVRVRAMKLQPSQDSSRDKPPVKARAAQAKPASRGSRVKARRRRPAASLAMAVGPVAATRERVVMPTPASSGATARWSGASRISPTPGMRLTSRSSICGSRSSRAIRRCSTNSAGRLYRPTIFSRGGRPCGG